MTQGTPALAQSTILTGGDKNHTLQTALNHEVTTKCISITDRYHSGVIEKVLAILELQEVILQDNKSTFLSVLAVYVKVLNGYKWINTPGGVPEGDCDRGESADPEWDKQEEDTAQVTKQHRAHSSELDDNESVRHKISIWDLPWVTRNETNSLYLLPSLITTQSILENISQDFKTVKASLLNSLTLPQFPESEWVSLLSGWAIDLNHVLASHYSTSHKEKCTEHIGDLEFFISGHSKPTKAIETHGNWVSAWDQTVEVMLFVFEHRATELREYGHHITQLFTSLDVPLHSRIIQYDCAIQNQVAQWWNLMLTNFTEFTDLHVLHIQKSGIAGSHSEKHIQMVGSGSRCRDACRWFNEGHCPNSQATCTYAHVCSKCCSNAHTAPECKAKPWGAEVGEMSKICEGISLDQQWTYTHHAGCIHRNNACITYTSCQWIEQWHCTCYDSRLPPSLPTHYSHQEIGDTGMTRQLWPEQIWLMLCDISLYIIIINWNYAK